MKKKSCFKIFVSFLVVVVVHLFSSCNTPTIEMCSVKYVSGHGIQDSIVMVEKGSTITLPRPVVEENMAFCCWSENGCYYTDKIEITEDHTFYAEWIPVHTGYYNWIAKNTYDKRAHNYYTRMNPNGGINVKGLIPSTPITDPESIYYGIDFNLPENNVAMAAFYLGYSGSYFYEIKYIYNLLEAGDRDGLDVIYFEANPGYYFDPDIRKCVPIPSELGTIFLDFDKQVSVYTVPDGYSFENNKNLNSIKKLPELYCCANLCVDEDTGEYIAQK